MALQNCTKIAIGWFISAGIGVYAFSKARKNINAKRYKNMKTRQFQISNNN